jgi:archaellum biogenesis ATPase FlaH
MMKIDLDSYERLIAYRALTDSTYLNAIADYVKPEYFENQNIAKYFEIVTTFYEKRKVLPTLTEVKTYLTSDVLKKGFKSLVESFKDIEKKLDKNELYQNTEQFLKERATAYQIGLIADDFEETTRNPSKVLAAFEEVCKICLDIEKGLEIYRDVDLIIDDILNVDSCIPSGWEWLDEALDGGWREDGKALYMFAGQANIGKSIFLGNVAASIAKQDKTVLVISLEMSEMLYAKRIASNVTKIPMRDFKDNTHSLRSSLMDEKKALPKSKIFIKEFPPSTVTSNQLSAFIKKLIDSGEHIDAIVIDYLSLLTTSVGSNSYEKILHICEQVRAMSYIFKCPIISAVQLGRQDFNKDNPGMEGIAGSIGIAATADVIMSIFQSEEDMEMGIIKLGMMKNRFGPRGMIQAMKIDYPTLTISQSSEESEIMDDDEMSLLEKFSN